MGLFTFSTSVIEQTDMQAIKQIRRKIEVISYKFCQNHILHLPNQSNVIQKDLVPIQAYT